MSSLAVLVHDEQVNAVLGWVTTGIVAVVVVGAARTGSFLWAALAAVVVAVAVLPAAATRDWTAMVPWPLLLTAAAATATGGTGRYLEPAGYVAVAALALIAVAELDAFSDSEMSRRFAVVLAVLTTLAVQGVWTVGQFVSDRRWGTAFLSTQAELQRDIVLVTVVAAVMGGLFVRYFGRLGDGDERWQSPSSAFEQ